MKKIICFFTFILILTYYPLYPSAEQEIDLILVAGQSNAVGADSPMDELPADPLDKNVMFWWRCGKAPADIKDSSSGQKWSTLQAQKRGGDKNFNCKGGGFGPEMGLARTLLKNNPERKIAIIKIAYNATAIDAWERKKPVAKQKPAYDNCYEALFVEVKLAIAEAKKKGITLVPRAFVWVQGESDASQELVPQYKDKLQQLIENVKNDFNAPKLISMLAVNTKFRYKQQKYVGEIAKKQEELAAEDKLVEYVDSSKLDTVNKYHFSAKGTLELGQLFADTLIRLEKKSK